ncbi:uncharacterized protein LOC144314205 isoform X2 [Canis aureus]
MEISICIYLNGTGGFCGQIFLLICMLALCPANCSLPTLPALSPRLRENVRLYLGLFSCCCSLETLSRKFPQPGCQRVWRARLCERTNQQRKPHLTDGRIVGACPLIGEATPLSSNPFQEP